MNAYFQPQVWINDHAVDTGPAVPFDVSDALRCMGRDKALALRDNREDTDDLAPADLLEHHREQYGDEGCFYVYGVEKAARALFAPEPQEASA